tara:strand:- start:640 stop:1314 length:675 start_codon:yes stop_codon:yes gene_type:complete
MQPTYLPYLGYFDLINRSDIFVFLNNVQFDKRSWQQRNRIKSNNSELMLTVPVLTKGKFEQEIQSVKIDKTQKFEVKHFNSIKNNYSKSQYFGSYINEFEKLLFSKFIHLADLNIELINWFVSKLGIKTKFFLSSELESGGIKTELLINICKELNGTKYLSPYGSAKYIEENNLFKKEGIELIYQNYSHPVYNQLSNSFIPYLSVIDLLFNEGEKSLEIIKKGS